VRQFQALEGPCDTAADRVRWARLDARRSLPPWTRYEIREDRTSPTTTTVAWIADTRMFEEPRWEPRRPGFDVVTGTFIHERAVTPAMVCLGCGLDMVIMIGVGTPLVCVCCGGGTLERHLGCRHHRVKTAVPTLDSPMAGPSDVIPLSCEDVEP
jgi:hypothetical protein